MIQQSLAPERCLYGAIVIWLAAVMMVSYIRNRSPDAEF